MALRLFELLTEPRIHLQNHFDFPEILAPVEKNKSANKKPKKIDYEIEWPEESRHWLDEAWKKVFQPHLIFLAEPLVMVVTKQLTFAHLILRGEEGTKHSFDILSWYRKSIAPHEQNRDTLHECLSVLIDAARDILVHWLNTNPARGRAQMEVWWASQFPLLRRLTVYGVAVDPQMTADERLQWVVKNDLVFGFGMKKEVFDILSVAYPIASESARIMLMQRISQGHKGKQRKKLGSETIAYEQFNVLVWLRRADKNCPLVDGKIAKIKEKYPEFGEREHPDFDSWIGKIGFVDPKEGFNFDQILSEPPGNYLAELRSAAESSMRRDRWSYLDNLKLLFGQKREWGRGFMDALTKEKDSTADIWNGVFWAWRGLSKPMKTGHGFSIYLKLCQKINLRLQAQPA